MHVEIWKMSWIDYNVGAGNDVMSWAVCGSFDQELNVCGHGY